jgi:hypothetical protein
MAKWRPSENQKHKTGFELFYETCWDLKAGLLLLCILYIVCASSIKRLPLIYRYLNLLSDKPD